MNYYIYNIENLHNKFEMEQDKFEDSIGQFEQLDQQFMTYSRSFQISPTNAKARKLAAASNSEKPKLKMIQDSNPKNNASTFLGNRKQRKNIASNPKILAIGDAIFRSNFESGNLCSVEKIAPNTYQIYLTKQMNSSRTSAWFYFICEGLKGQNKLIIKGFTKSTSLYNSGMKICYREIEQGSQWRRGGTKISYTESFCQDQDARTTYQLQFSYFFKSTPKAVEFAYCFPYTYTHLINFITLSKVQFESLGQTYEGRQIPLLTLGNPSSQKVVVLSARAHPGQTVGSLMMEGFLRELIAENKYSSNLRKAFLFKIVPMINIDGVVNGNYRFSASGFDLNRKWKRCSRKLHPEVFLLKQYIRTLNKDKKVIMYIDLHGHSRQKNVFFYGCCPRGQLTHSGQINTKPKEFPFLMSKIFSPFRYDYCSYAVQKEKEGTARICMWNQLKIDYVYTLEASFCSSEGSGNYLMSDYYKIGAKLCQGICLHFWSLIRELVPMIQEQKNSQSSHDKLEQELHKNMNQFFQNPGLANVQYEGNSSDSEPEAGEIPIQERKNMQKTGIMSIQKYYKASKIMKYSNRNAEIEENKYFKNKSQQTEGKNDQSRNKTNQSIRLAKVDQINRKTFAKSQSRPHSKNNSNKFQNLYEIKADILNKTINQKLGMMDSSLTLKKNEIKRQQSEEGQQFEGLDQKQDQYSKSKKKALNFQGAQYRRVRKMAEEHNRRHHSAQQHTQMCEDETLIRGLIGMNNLIEVGRIYPRNRPASFFPNTTATNYKNRKNSMEMHFRRQIKAHEYTSRRLHVNGTNQEVKCLGKQIF